jgi:hypothetical protein
MKKMIFIILVLCVTKIYSFEFYMGPRVGMLFNIQLDDTRKETDLTGQNFYNFPRSILGIAFEQRVKLGETGHYFAFREYGLFEGVESTVYNFSGTWLSFGLLFENHFQLFTGAGFNAMDEDVLRLSFSAGYELVYRQIHIPIDINVLIPKGNSGTTISITIGLNFRIGK